MKKLILLLTGSINPRSMTFTVLQDSKLRKQQYLDSIKFYIDNTDLPIVFIENSGVDLSGSFLSEIQNGRLEVLTFDGNNYDRKLGKGYGEMLILEHAFSCSDFLRNAEFFFKITGRYKVLNIHSFREYYKTNKASIDIFINFKPDLSFVDSRFFGAKVSFLDDLFLKYKDFINDSEGIYFEHVLCKAVHESIINGYKYSCLHHFPRFSGIYATTGMEYNHSWFNWFPKEVLSLVLAKIQNILVKR